MRIYLVRHGEGEHNVKKLYSHTELSLTDKGRAQAQDAAKRLIKLPIELIIASPFKRTKQTAEIINQELQKEIIYSDLITEIRRPSEIAGQNMHLPEVKKIKQVMDDNSHLSNWHYSDEENFFDLQNRVIEFIAYLEQLDHQHILVVSHLHTIRMLILTMMFGPSLSPQLFQTGSEFLTHETSGLTICEFQKPNWQLITWNDHAHLAEVESGFAG